jgi:predicted metal-dependent hydrolase
MQRSPQTGHFGDIEYTIVFSRRRTLGISILPDSRVVVRAPLKASLATINGIVSDKAGWIRKHLDNHKTRETKKLNGDILNGEKQLYRGNECKLVVTRSEKPFVRFNENTIELGLDNPENQVIIKRLLQLGFRNEAARIFPLKVNEALVKYSDQDFRITGLVLRTMKSRWGTCSRKGVITLNTELVKLPEKYLEYVIAHELCHLKHHNHGKEYYLLLSKLFPEWKVVRQAMKEYIH